jgi:hypothetical protein
MKTIKDRCIEFLHSEDTRHDVRAIIQPIGSMIYNEAYPYLWFLCVYHVFLTFIILAILILLIRVLNHLGGFYLASEMQVGHYLG